MQAALALHAFVRGAGDAADAEEAMRARVGALLVYELLWHLRALSGQDFQIKIVG